MRKKRGCLLLLIFIGVSNTLPQNYDDTSINQNQPTNRKDEW